MYLFKKFKKNYTVFFKHTQVLSFLPPINRPHFGDDTMRRRPSSIGRLRPPSAAAAAAAAAVPGGAKKRRRLETFGHHLPHFGG